MSRRPTVRMSWIWLPVAAGLGLALVPRIVTAAPSSAGYTSPLGVAAAPDGSAVYVAEHTADKLAVVDPVSEVVARTFALPKGPAQIVVAPDGGRLYVSCAKAGIVAVVDPTTGRVGKEIKVGAWPWGMALSTDGGTLYVCNRFTNDVSVVNTSQEAEVARIPVVREPGFCALSESTTTLVVGNMLALGSDHDPKLAAEISLIDTTSATVSKSFRLPSGCNEVAGVCCSPDGKWAYAVHLLSRFLIPPTQIERGWINTNALSVIDLTTKELLATVLIDDLTLGAANPYGLAISPDGTALYISLRGSHQAMTIDVPGLHRIIDETPVEQRPVLADDLTFLYRNGVKKRADVGGLGPTGLAILPDGKKLFVAGYFSGTVSVVRTRDLKVTGSVALGDPEEMTPARRGEFLFHDAKSCMQEWQSCSSCHLDARADGLMWDLLNDGLGNPKNAKSLVLSGVTPPVMAHGVRADMRTAVEAGFRYILFREPTTEDIDSVAAYIDSLEPEQSPILSMGQGKRAAIERGRKLFESPEIGCSGCHPAPLYTDLQMSDVGTASKYDRGNGNFDTPTLVELYRTAPYLHDGTAVTLEDVLTTRNPEDKHGHTSRLSGEQIEDLVAFLLSL